MRKLLRSQRGEGLISVLISIAILGILIVTVVTMYQMFGTMMAKSLLRREADTLAQRVRGVLLHRDLCKQALVPNTWDGASEADITIWDTGGVVMAKEGVTIANGRLRMKKVFLRPYQLDADGDGSLLNNNLVADVSVKVGGQASRARSGEVVIRFELASDAVRSGELAERRIAVMLLVDPSNNHIKDCDINEESVKTGGGTPPCDGGEADALADGNVCPAPPAPYSIDECRKVAYVMKVDAFGEPKCGCAWSCVTPYYRNVTNTGLCSKSPTIPVGSTPCPAATISGGKGYCAGKLGLKCFWRVADGSCPPTAPVARPYAQYRATCMLPPKL